MIANGCLEFTSIFKYSFIKCIIIAIPALSSAPNNVVPSVVNNVLPFNVFNIGNSSGDNINFEFPRLIGDKSYILKNLKAVKEALKQAKEESLPLAQDILARAKKANLSSEIVSYYENMLNDINGIK